MVDRMEPRLPVVGDVMVDSHSRIRRLVTVEAVKRTSSKDALRVTVGGSVFSWAVRSECGWIRYGGFDLRSLCFATENDKADIAREEVWRHVERRASSLVAIASSATAATPAPDVTALLAALAKLAVPRG